MTRVLATSTVIGIFAVFFALHAAVGTSSNRDQIETLEWDIEFEVPSQIGSLESVVDDIQSTMDSLEWDVEDIQSAIDSLQSTINSLEWQVADIQSTLDR